MAAKKHIVVPRNFTDADVQNGCFNSEKFAHITRKEAHELRAQGRIEPIGSSGRVWQLVEDLPVRASRPTGRGRLSLEIPRSLGTFVASEMRRRPSWVLQPLVEM